MTTTSLWDRADSAVTPPGGLAEPGPGGARQAEEQEALDAIDRILARLLGAAADSRLVRKLRPLLLDALIAGAQYAADDLGVEVVIGLSHPIAEGYVQTRVPNLVGVNRFTRRRIRNVIAEEIRKGSPLGRQVSRMRREFQIFRRGRRDPTGKRGLARARTVARTETGIAWGTGQHAQMREAGSVGKLWITSRDVRVRKSHLIDGQCQAIDDPFITAAGNEMQHPLDPTGPAGEVINCRCAEAPAPQGCGDLRLATYEARTRYWRAVIAQQRPHEMAIARAIRVIWTEQENAIAKAMREEAA
jgi:hypothetical protein